MLTLKIVSELLFKVKVIMLLQFVNVIDDL